MRGTIKLGRHTAKHAETLQRLGYEVEVSEDKIYVEGTGTVSELDLSQGLDPLKEVIANKQLLTYKSKVTFEDGTWNSLAMCGKLGELSCLVVSTKSGLTLDLLGL